MQIELGQTFAWDAVAGSTSYDVELQNEALNSQLGFFNVATPSITAAILLANSPAGNYNVRVRARNSTLIGDYSAYTALAYIGLGVPGNFRVE